MPHDFQNHRERAILRCLRWFYFFQKQTDVLEHVCILLQNVAPNCYTQLLHPTLHPRLILLNQALSEHKKTTVAAR